MKLGEYTIELSPEGGLLIRPEGMGDCYSNDGDGHPILIIDNAIYIWGDINEEDFTTKIDLSGAFESSRNDTESGGEKL